MKLGGCSAQPFLKRVLIFSFRIKLMAEGELKDMEQFFDDLSDSFSGTEPEVHRTSVVGMGLLRRTEYSHWSGQLLRGVCPDWWTWTGRLGCWPCVVCVYCLPVSFSIPHDVWTSASVICSSWPGSGVCRAAQLFSQSCGPVACCATVSGGHQPNLGSEVSENTLTVVFEVRAHVTFL